MNTKPADKTMNQAIKNLAKLAAKQDAKLAAIQAKMNARWDALAAQLPAL